ncbi:hypothetical protein PG985_014083 [Apiospora marii]|uniref:uncharacterized protein n=1 Tax=Apiospora marii TaxID=335849 RepID=UPI00312F3537
MDILDRLPPELQLRALGTCASGDLLSICLLSRRFYHVCLPILYHSVDLSSHNRDAVAGTDGFGREFEYPSDWVDRDEGFGDVDSRLYERQLVFLRTLHAKPDLGSYVRELHWTTACISYVATEKELEPHLRPCAVEDYDGAWFWVRNRLYYQLRKVFDFPESNSYLWEAFGFMDRIKDVDIAFVNRETREADPPPPGLFSSAQSIRLTGIASRNLIKSLLSSTDPSCLKELHLNNITEFAELYGIREGITVRKKGQTRPFPTTISSRAGPMLTHLRPFIGKWTNLDTLAIDTVGEPTPGAWGIASAETEEKRYEEIGAFIRSVASQLRVLHFQQGLNGYYHGFRRPGRCGAPTMPHPDGIRPMDSRFHRHVLPAITESTWPRLRRLELFGVASYTYRLSGKARVANLPLSDDDQNNIRRAVGDEVGMDIRPDATKDFWVAESDETGIQEIEEGNDTESDEDAYEA